MPKKEIIKKKILVIDDDEEFLEELRDMLVMSGYDAIAVNDGTDALRIAKSIRPDLILVDIKMKGLNGLQVADKLNQYVETVDIPIVAMSGHFNGTGRLPLMEDLGIKALIRKPFRPLDVISHIEKFTDDYSGWSRYL